MISMMHMTGTAACVAMENAPGSNVNLARSESSSTLGSYQGAMPGQSEPDVSARRLSDQDVDTPCSVFHTISSSIPPAPDAESFPCQACQDHDATVPDYLITTSQCVFSIGLSHLYCSRLASKLNHACPGLVDPSPRMPLEEAITSRGGRRR